jgi:hypothetical protein
LWPGDLINTPGFDYLDIFNVNEDRTIMVTGGILNLAFSGISILIENQYGDTKDFFVDKSTILSTSKMLQYFFYKVSNTRSVMEKVFSEENDKPIMGKKPEDLPNPYIAEKGKEKERNTRISNLQQSEMK